jgi:hypothetical protein
MKIRPLDVVDCWFVTDAELKAANSETKFSPTYLPYAYFHLLKRSDQNNLEGFIGRDDRTDDFHEAIITTYTYFADYQDYRKVYVTLDKTVFYEIIEIFPGKPLTFMLKKVTTQPVNDLSQLPPISGTIHRLPFQQLGGEIFERLVFAYVNQMRDWNDIQWLGETGKDKGRDIWAVGTEGRYCYQCANYQQLTSKKVIDDMDKLVKHGGIPDHLIIVCGGKVSDQLRSKVISYAQKNAIPSVAVWSGSELEERLRKFAPGILQRFFQSTPFPENLAIANISDSAGEVLPALELALLPTLRLNNTLDELAVFLAEAFYNLEKGINPAINVTIAEEQLLTEKARSLAKFPKTIDNRNALLELKKIGDLLTNLKREMVEKVRLLFLADLYPLNNDFLKLAGCLGELLKLSYDGKILYEETELVNIISAEQSTEKALKFQGKWKIDVYRAFGNKPGFSIWLSDAEFEQLKAKLPPSISPKDMWFFGFECSDLSVTTLSQKVIPAFIDKIYDLQRNGELDVTDKNSWSYLASYLLGMG